MQTGSVRASRRCQGKGLACSSNGRRLASVGLSGIEVIDLDSSKTAITNVPGLGYRAHALVFSPDGRKLASNVGGQLVVWDLSVLDTK